MKHLLKFENFINESSFNDILYNNIVILTDKYVKNIIRTNDIIVDYLYQYISSEGLDEDDIDEIRESEDFFNYIKTELENMLETATYNIENCIDEDGYIKIYRAMTVDENWLEHLAKKGKRLGIYWTWDFKCAEPHWGYSKNKKIAIITAIIDEKYINWKDTMELNIDFNCGDEHEIRLYKNTPLEIINISIDDEDIDISFLENKTLIA